MAVMEYTRHQEVVVSAEDWWEGMSAEDWWEGMSAEDW